MSINHNKYNLKVGETVILDESFANSSQVKIVEFTPMQMYATVEDVHGGTWTTMTNRLTPMKKKCPYCNEGMINLPMKELLCAVCKGTGVI